MPCGTPDKTGAHLDFAPLITTLCFLEHKNESIHRRVLPLLPLTPYPNSLHLRISWDGVSNAFSKSIINVSTCPPLSKVFAQLFITVTNWVSQPCFSCMHVAYLTRDCVFQGDLWCLSILCAQVTCREYMLMRQGDNCLLRPCHPQTCCNCNQ